MAKKNSHSHGSVRRDIPGELPAGARAWTPLSAGFMVASIVGFFVSLLYISKFSLPMSVAFAVVFLCMFLASIISMGRASPDAQLAARPIK
ncbi:MAG: hypothetical protein QXM31_01465 [Candidatus Woesearchaeota archaeon]